MSNRKAVPLHDPQALNDYHGGEQTERYTTRQTGKAITSRDMQLFSIEQSHRSPFLSSPKKIPLASILGSTARKLMIAEQTQMVDVKTEERRSLLYI